MGLVEGVSTWSTFVFQIGAIAQLGERVLCKHEVVGSIPSGSTSLLAPLASVASGFARLATWPTSPALHLLADLQLVEDPVISWLLRQPVKEFACLSQARCAISDIVKRK